MLTNDMRVVPLTLLAQAALSLGMAALLAIWFGQVAAISALLGGLTAVIPNAFLAARLVKPRRHDDAKAVMRSAWIGEIGKLLLTVMLFGAIFAAVRPISALAVFGGFIAAQSAVFGALFVTGGAVNVDLETKS